MKKRNVIGKAEIKAATEELLAWRREREGLATRIREEESWYRMRVAPHARQNSEGERIAPTSAWLFNALMQKHADLMENIPTAVCLPREESDEADAEALYAILPVILANMVTMNLTTKNYYVNYRVFLWKNAPRVTLRQLLAFFLMDVILRFVAHAKVKLTLNQ